MYHVKIADLQESMGEQKIVCPNEELCVKKPITQEERRKDVPLYQRACYVPL